MAKLTEEELKKIIQEEINEIDEGFLDRLKAKASGRLAQAGALGSNIKKGVGDAVRKTVKGSDNFEPSRAADTGNVRRLAGAKSIIASYSKRVGALNNEMEKDFKDLESAGIQTSGMKKLMDQLNATVAALEAQIEATEKSLKKERG